MASFIIEHMDEIVAEWESFAREVSPASVTMDASALRDHVRQMLQAIAEDIETEQSAPEQEEKSKGGTQPLSPVETAAETHGQLRHTSGFDLSELVAEFRALRASVLRIWMASKRGDSVTAYQITRFNEAIDQALAESVATYSAELTRSRDTFLAILGHDLRSPLGALANALQILADPNAVSRRDETLAVGNRSVAVMGGMIRDLLEYTRARLGKGIPITLERGDLKAVCKAAFSEVSLVYPQAAFRFEATMPTLEAMIDSDRMHQVVSNLLNNAVQHGQRGFAVFLVVSADENNLVIEVKNRGRPIAAELLQVIFDPLVQLPTEDSATERFSNLGLGLFIAQQIVLAHGGTIRASSSGEETVFTVEIPRIASLGTNGPSIPTQLRAPPSAQLPHALSQETRHAEGQVRQTEAARHRIPDGRSPQG